MKKVWDFHYNKYRGVSFIPYSLDNRLRPRDAYRTLPECRRAALDSMREREKNLEDELHRLREHIAALGETIRKETGQ